MSNDTTKMAKTEFEAFSLTHGLDLNRADRIPLWRLALKLPIERRPSATDIVSWTVEDSDQPESMLAAIAELFCLYTKDTSASDAAQIILWRRELQTAIDARSQA